MIVVEGPDGAGKSTLIEAIKTETGLPVAPRVVGKDTNALTNLVDWVEDNVTLGFQYTIFDRHRLISEPIYASVMGRASEGFDDVQWLSRMNFLFYRFCNPIIIYCLPPYDIVREHVENDDTNQPTRVQREIKRLYNMYVAKTAADLAGGAEAMHYDFTSMTPDRAVDFINRALGRTQQKYNPPAPRVVWND